MIKLKIFLFSIGATVMLLLPGCSAGGEDSEVTNQENAENENNYTALVEPVPLEETDSRSVENIISDGIARFQVSLSEEEKAEILEPVKASLHDQLGSNPMNRLRVKIESMLDLREAQLKGDANFDSLLEEHLKSSFSESEWSNTVSSIPDMNALISSRKKLEEQFPSSRDEAILQAKDALFRQALTQKLKDQLTQSIVATPADIDDFINQLKDDSNIHVSYVSKYGDVETAVLFLKKDKYWDEWLKSQN